MREELCYGNYKNVEDILRRYDSKLGDLFHRLSRPMMEELCYGREKDSDGLLLPATSNGLLDIDQLEAEGINVIPGNTKIGCQESCVVYADGEWKNKKNSFLSLSKKLIGYWLECFNINKRTLVFTTTWDEKSFIRSYRSEYDSYANNHVLAVVLMTSTGPSIQYIGK